MLESGRILPACTPAGWAWAAGTKVAMPAVTPVNTVATRIVFLDLGLLVRAFMAWSFHVIPA
jgi:hypothetical protein